MRTDLDVRELPPPEPLELVLAEIQSLAPGDWVCLRHRQQPYPLYNLLESGGLAWRVHCIGPRDFQIDIWRLGDTAAEQEVERYQL